MRKESDRIWRDVVFVTGNEHKLREAQAVVGPLKHADIDLPEIQELDPRRIVLAKAQSALSHGFNPVLIEDSSLSIRGLGGLPGPLVKWFLKAVGGAGLARMAEASGDPYAEVRTFFGLAFGPQKLVYGEGSVEGRIVAPRGGGFGWDSIFEPRGSNKTYGEMSTADKALDSMRTRALQDLRHQVERFFAGR